MKIALVQQHATGNLADNVARGLAAVDKAASEGAKLVVFAELAFTPFYPQHRLSGDRMELAEPIPGPITNAFVAAAKRLGVVVVLNLYERDEDKAFDSSPVIDSDGTLLGVTRMCHITQYEGFFEQDYYDPGDSGVRVYETAVGRIGVAICYDRHFPEYMRELALEGADLVVIPQAGTYGEWPEGVYEAELQTAAFQNGYFVALSNRVGEEDALTFAGESVVVDPRGQIVAQAPSLQDAILYADLDMEELASSPARRLFLKHRRPDVFLHDLTATAADHD